MRRPLLILPAFFSATVATGTYAQVAETPTDVAIMAGGFDVTLGADERERMDALAARLGSPVYDDRERAAAELVEIGVRAFAPLRAAYHACQDLDTRLRIEAIVFQAYVEHQVYQQVAFLGIGPKPGLVSSDTDKRVPPGRLGIELNQIIPDTAAARANLAPNDIILALNGEPIGSKTLPGFEAFAEAIRTSGAGSTVTLEVVRTRHVFQVQATLGRAPKGSEVSMPPVRDRYLQTLRDFDVWWRKSFRHAGPPTASDESDDAGP